MSPDGASHPSHDAWVAAIHGSETDFKPLGAGVVIDARRVLTCAHVVVSADGTTLSPLWVAFPKAEDPARARRRVQSVEISYDPPVRDLAVLVLAEPIPADVGAAPLRCPAPSDLVGRQWWAFGFPDGDPVGNSTEGQIGASLGYGWVRLDREARYQIEPGFSGGGLWSPAYQAVVGLVGQAHSNGDGRSVTLHQADLSFPNEKLAQLASWTIEAAGEMALTAWGWSLERDPEAGRHWRPRGRGVSINSERGYRFRGRTAALTAIVRWLDRPRPNRRVLVVTGSPGVGKSAVLGRIVTTADAAIRKMLPTSDSAIRATIGSVSCAVHVKGKSALEVATEIARAASARLPEDPADLAPAVRDALADRRSQRFNVIIDALDEATNPAQARAIIDKIVLPLAETCSDMGAQVVVGTRRRDDGGELLARFGNAIAGIDLDDAEYFADEDLTAYALACLQLAGDERPDNPYAETAVAELTARRIAGLSDRNFLVAGLMARSHGLHDSQPADPEHLTFAATVDAALAAYLDRVPPVGIVPADLALTILAFAEAPGLPIDLWQLGLEALSGTHVTTADLSQFARSSAANFLIETGADTGSRHFRVFRLFHQALNDALLRARADVAARNDDERAVATAFIRRGRESNWGEAPGYLLRSLAGHAVAAGLIDELLSDDSYLLRADLPRLLQAGASATSPYARNRSRLLRLTPRAITADPAERSALFSVTEALENVGVSFCRSKWDVPYRARWASARPRDEETVFTHSGGVRAVSAFNLGDGVLLASASEDGTIQIWDPATGRQHTVLEGHLFVVNSVCDFSLRGQPRLASAGEDRTVRIWDPATGELQTTLRGHLEPVNGVCSFSRGDQTLLASAGDDGTVRVWNPATGRLRGVLKRKRTEARDVCTVTLRGRSLLAVAWSDGELWVWDPSDRYQAHVRVIDWSFANAICAFTQDSRSLLACAGEDGDIVVLDIATFRKRAVLNGHQDPVNAVCAFTRAGRVLLASAGDDDTLRTWDLDNREQLAVFRGHQDRVTAVCAFTVGSQEFLATGSDDDTVRIWDPVADRKPTEFDGHAGWVTATCVLPAMDKELLASCSDDDTIRIWDPATGRRLAIIECDQDGVRGICALAIDGQMLLATAGDRGNVRILEPLTGECSITLTGHEGPVYGLCTFMLSDQVLLASAGADSTVRIWEPASGSELAVLGGFGGPIYGLCAFTIGGRTLIACARDDGAVLIWDPITKELADTYTAHEDWANGVCALTVNGRVLLASGGADETVRIWDVGTRSPTVLHGHEDSVRGVCALTIEGRTLLASAGLDCTVRVWDPATSDCLLTIPVHHRALAVSWAADSLIVTLTAGLLLIEVSRVS
jgi:WD40 repeat protein